MSLLKRLATKYGTDKAKFGYTDIYEMYLDSVRMNVKKVIEIGVKKGASLRMWRDYFPNAFILGLDNNPKTMFTEERIETILFDQSLGFEEYEKVLNKYDVIIDDGSHWQSHIMNSYRWLYDMLNVGGHYFIEDVANEEISLKKGKMWGSVEPDFSDAVIKIFERKKQFSNNINIFYAQNKPLTEAATSDVIVVKKVS